MATIRTYIYTLKASISWNLSPFLKITCLKKDQRARERHQHVFLASSSFLPFLPKSRTFPRVQGMKFDSETTWHLLLFLFDRKSRYIDWRGRIYTGEQSVWMSRPRNSRLKSKRPRLSIASTLFFPELTIVESCSYFLEMQMCMLL